MPKRSSAPRELDTVNTVSRELAGKLDLSALIELVGEQIRALFRPDIAYVALLDRVTDTIHFPYRHGDVSVIAAAWRGAHQQDHRHRARRCC